MGEFVATMGVPLLGCVALVGIHAHFGIHVLARRVVFADLALAQLVALGAVVGERCGFAIDDGGIGNHAFSFGCGLLGAAVLSSLTERDERAPREALVGVIYAAASALTILLSIDLPHGLDQVRMLLAGNVEWLRGTDVAIAAAIYAAVGCLHWAMRRTLARRPRTRAGELVFFASFALVVTSSVHLAGVFLVFAYLVVPALISLRFATRHGARLGVGCAVGLLASALGVAIAYALDVPCGPVIVVVLGAMLTVALAFAAQVSVASGRSDLDPCRRAKRDTVPHAATFAIPCRNAGRHLEPLLGSLLRQTRCDFALLLVDDASTDGSAARARRVVGDRIEIVENREPLGLAANWNRCASLVRTDSFCLAHQDDVYEPDYLECMLEALAREPNAALAHCRAHAIDESGTEVASAAEAYKERFWRGLERADRAETFDRLFRGNFVCCPSVLYRTDAWQRLGGFDERLRFAPDWKLWFDALLAGFELAAVPRDLVGYRRHAQSASVESARDLSRFREERTVLEHAAARGVAAGLLGDAAARGRSALRNTILHDAYRDLRSRDVEGARRKLAFVRDEVPELARDPAVRCFARLLELGTLGRIALGLGLRAALLRARA